MMAYRRSWRRAPEDGDSVALHKVGALPHHYTVSQPKDRDLMLQS